MLQRCLRPLPYHRITRSRPLVTLVSDMAHSSLSLDTINPALLNVQYAVRGELAIRAEAYRVKIKENPNNHGLPFDKIVNSNIGNPQQLGLDQKPLTFGRQVSSLASVVHRYTRSPSRSQRFLNIQSSWKLGSISFRLTSSVVPRSSIRRSAPLGHTRIVKEYPIFARV